MFRRVLVLLGLIAAQAGGAAAQQPVSGTLQGIVLDAASGEPVAHASIQIIGSVRRSMDDDGRFTARRVPAGTVRYIVRALGYQPTEGTADIPPGGAAEITVRLTPAPYVLGRVRTEAAATDRERFEQIAEVGAVTISRQTISSIPSAGEPDLLRVVQLLPGVGARNDYSAGYNVRGGESDQNLVLLDGIPIYNPFHLGGMFSTFLDEAVSHIELQTGGFPAPHTGRLSSVLDVRSHEEGRQGINGTVSMSLLASSLVLGGALPTATDAWGVGIRRTYADKVIGAFTDEVLPYHFRDAQAHYTHVFRNGGSVSLTAYDGTDVFDGVIADEGEDSTALDVGSFALSWGNSAVGLTLALPLPEGRLGLGALGFRLGDTASFVQRVSVTRFRTGFDIGEGSLAFRNRVVEWRAQGTLGARRGAHQFGIGYEASVHRVRYTSSSPATDARLLEMEQHPTAFGLWIDEQWRVHDRVLLRLGARGETVTGTGWRRISPRAAIKYFVSPDLAVTAAGGRYAQWMHSMRDEDLPVRIFDFWLSSDRTLPVSEALHGVLGVERWYGNARLIRTEGWIKRYYDLLEPNPADDPDERGDEFNVIEGGAYGVDLHLRQFDRGGFSGWVTYGYALAKRWGFDRKFFPAQDRRHSLQAIANWRLPSRTVIGAHFGLGSGTPYTPIVGQIVRRVYDGTRNQWDTGIPSREIQPVGGVRNSERYPMYHRLDVSIEKEITLRYGWRFRPYLQVLNVYDRRNVFTYRWSYTENPPTRRAISQFPVVPSIGFTLDF